MWIPTQGISATYLFFQLIQCISISLLINQLRSISVYKVIPLFYLIQDCRQAEYLYESQIQIITLYIDKNLKSCRSCTLQSTCTNTIFASSTFNDWGQAHWKDWTLYPPPGHIENRGRKIPLLFLTDVQLQPIDVMWELATKITKGKLQDVGLE